MSDNELSVQETTVLDGPRFMEMMEERGLLFHRAPTKFERLKTVVTFPFRLIGRVLSRITWHLWRKRAEQREIAVGMARWKQLAGAGPIPEYPIVEFDPCELARAKALHEEIIKSKIVVQPPPRPDVE